MAVVGTWNLENLFRPGGDFGPPDDAAYRAKLRAIARVVNTVGFDVLGVQEIGDPDALADLVDLLDGEWHTVLDAAHLPSIGDNPRAAHPVRASDHSPVLVNLAL